MKEIIDKALNDVKSNWWKYLKSLVFIIVVIVIVVSITKGCDRLNQGPDTPPRDKTIDSLEIVNAVKKEQLIEVNVKLDSLILQRRSSGEIKYNTYNYYEKDFKRTRSDNADTVVGIWTELSRR